MRKGLSGGRNRQPSAANDFTKREKTENLDGTNTESNGVGDSISLDGFSNLLWVLDSSLGLALEKLKDSLELSSRWRSQTFLDVDLLGKLANNLGPENSLEAVPLAALTMPLILLLVLLVEL